MDWKLKKNLTINNIQAVHPDNFYRNTSGWAKLLKIANTLLFLKSGDGTLSVNMKMRNPKGKFREVLFQCYLFYSDAPRKTVYDLQVHTDIDHFSRRKTGYHYYAGKDLSFFKYPTQDMLSVGIPFTKREFEIVQLIEQKFSSQEVASKMFVSVHTVNTHRRNILNK